MWCILLAVLLIAQARRVYGELAAVSEFPFGCDAFGYLVMARDIRGAFHGSGEIPFRFENDQSRYLINKFKATSIPLQRWNDVVAPHAHYYFPEADAVGVQYPPGTGLFLSLFPEGSALISLNVMALLVITGGGVLLLFFALFRRRPLGAGVSALSAFFGQELLRHILSASYSINAILFSISAMFLLLFAFRQARLKQNDFLAFLMIFMAGLFCGISLLIRISYVFVLPGLALLVWVLGSIVPDDTRGKYTWMIAPGVREGKMVSGIRRLFFDRFLWIFVLGVLLAGIVPQALQQQLIGGAWYLPTYSNHDVTSPALSLIGESIRYYFATPETAVTWMYLPWYLPPFIYAVVMRFPVNERRARFCIAGTAGILAVIWGLPLLYFLTHSVRIAYYLIPFHYTLALTFVLLVFLLEDDMGRYIHTPARSSPPTIRPIWMRILVVILTLLPGLPVLREGKKITDTIRPRTVRTRQIRFELPRELEDRRNWIWADLVTGTIWYYYRRPAFRITPTDTETRARLYRFAAEYGGKQYFIEDAVWMASLRREIQKLGGRVIPAGQFGHAPFRFSYYRIEWPAR